MSMPRHLAHILTMPDKGMLYYRIVRGTYVRLEGTSVAKIVLVVWLTEEARVIQRERRVEVLRGRSPQSRATASTEH